MAAIKKDASYKPKPLTITISCSHDKSSAVHTAPSISHPAKNPSNIKVSETHSICGFDLDFYSTGLILPNDFMNEHQIEKGWLVSIQSGKEYKAMHNILR